MSKFSNAMGLSAPPSTLTTVASSHLIGAKGLFIFRACVATYTLGLLVWRSIVFGPTFFDFLTNLSWTGITIFFLLGTFMSSAYLRSNADPHAMPKWAITLYETLFSLSLSLSFVVSAVFWILLSKQLANAPDVGTKFALANTHSLNFIFMQAELWLGRIPLPYYRVVFFIGTVLLYAGLVYVRHYLGGAEWPYGFFSLLDIKANTGRALLGLLLFAVGLSLFFTIGWAEARLRDSIMARKYGKDEQPSELPTTKSIQ
ncbi:hypothetical protein BC831DRAFT_450712 [Entophlyctis helioformis]|nr:hypothetical protein BC831DRAFT_450712 [Entophlyctis helioformis]